MQTATIAWLAGLLEGEASFSNGSRNCGSARIDINMTDRDVIDKVAAIFKSNVYITPKLNQKTTYTAVCSGARAAGLMMTVYPFMGQRRRARISKALHQWRTYQRKKQAYNPVRPTICKHGHAFTPKNTYDYTAATGRRWRACRTCKARLDRRAKDAAIARRRGAALH